MVISNLVKFSLENMSKDKQLSVFAVLMMGIISIISLRNVPITAQYGISVIWIYFVVTVVFLIPAAIAISELSTKFPQSGGITIWVNKAYGNSISSCVVVMQWVYHMIFFPTLTVFCVTHLYYFISGLLSIDAAFFIESKAYLTVGAILIFWLGVFINLRGMIVSTMLSSLSAIFGVILPIILICLLSLKWLIAGHRIELPLDHLFGNYDNIPLIIIVFFSLVGLELPATYADKVNKPKLSIPRAVYLTAVVAPILLVLVNLSVSTVMPRNLINDRSGLIATFGVFFKTFNLHYMEHVMALVLAIGSFGCLSSWMLVLTKYLQTISEYNSLLKIFTIKNRNNVAIRSLIMQGIIYSTLCLVYLWMPSIREAYLFLSSLSAQICLLTNAIFFMAAIKLRLNYAWSDAYQFSRNRYISVAIFIIGMISSCVAVVLGFFVIDITTYLHSLGYIIISGIPIIILIKWIIKDFKIREV